MQKTISGRVAVADTAPFNYTSPMDTMIKITDNIFDNTNVKLGNNNGLVANDNNKSSVIGPIYSISESGKFAGFTRLGVTADFRSWLTGLDVATGTYGIKILIYTDIINAPGSIQKNAVYELTFNSADMIGNPYQFESYFYQEQVFDISMINNINKIDVYFYQDGKFADGNGNPIPWQYEDQLLGSTKMPANLFVNNVKLYLGYESGKFTDETLMLFTSDSLSYHYTQYKPHTTVDLIKNISLRWINKVSENEFRLLDGKNLEENFEVRWFRYNMGCETIDKYAGKDWERVYPTQDDAFIYSFSPNVKKQIEQIKVIGLISETILQDIKLLEDNEEYQSDLIILQEKYLEIENYEQDENYLQELEILQEKYLTLTTVKPYYSNLLVFENEEKVPDIITVDASRALSIVCMDNSEGNYFLYDQNGQIIDEGQGQGYLRTVEARYYGATINESLGKIDYLRWYFPDEIHGGNAYTMILNDLPVTEIADYYGIDYVMSERGASHIDAVTGNLNTAQTYSIKNYFNLTDANNTIRCVLSINGVEYEATKEFLFGKAGTNGSNATFVLSFMDNKDALIAAEDEEVIVKVQLYDANNSRVGFTKDQVKNITWSWFKTSDNPFMEIVNNADNATVTLKYIPEQDGVTRSWNENYHILKASYNYNGIGLEAYLPIPIKRDSRYTQFEGAKSVIYDHSGSPTYYPKEYKLHEYVDGKHTEIEQLNWELNYDEDINNADAMTESLIPKLKDSNAKPGYKALSASAFFTSGFNDKVCVSCSKNGNVLWSQPILVMQSQYDFAMLNSWDNSLTIDEENGTILSTMLGAGRKNADDNTFSGVLIGDIKQGTDLNSADNMTGVYGYHHGIQSYSLKEDGTATFGKPGRGQIQLDGNTGIIKSAGYFSEDATGMLIDLDNGHINIKNNGYEKINIQPYSNKGPYLTINSEQNVPLMSVGDSEYFLQSHSYDIYQGARGTKLNLDDGTFTIKGPAGSVSMSGNYLLNSPESYDLFKITDNNNQTLVEMDNANNYYLKSSTYDRQAIQTTTDGKYKIYKVPDGKRTISNGMGTLTFTAYVGVDSNNQVYDTSVSNNQYSITGSRKNFQTTTVTFKVWDNSTNKEIDKKYTYSPEQYNLLFIHSLIPVYTKVVPSGLKIDLNKGSIVGYDLYLRGAKLDNKGNLITDKHFTLDSSANEHPFTIGNNFKVGWDGTLTCYKLNTLTNTDNEKDYTINISNNFYVTPSGNAGGSGVRFSGSFGGYCSGVGVFSALTLNDKALSCTSFTYANGLQMGRITGQPAISTGSVDIVTGPQSISTLYYKTETVIVNGTPIHSTQISTRSFAGSSSFSAVKSLTKGRLSVKTASKNIVSWAASTT